MIPVMAAVGMKFYFLPLRLGLQTLVSKPHVLQQD